MILNLKGERILRLREVRMRTGLARSTIYELMRKQQFPQTIRIGARAVGWLDSEITTWVSHRVSQTRGQGK